MKDQIYPDGPEIDQQRAVNLGLSTIIQFDNHIPSYLTRGRVGVAI